MTARFFKAMFDGTVLRNRELFETALDTSYALGIQLNGLATAPLSTVGAFPDSGPRRYFARCIHSVVTNLIPVDPDVTCRHRDATRPRWPQMGEVPSPRW